MGGAESTPEKKTYAYEPSFLDAHVKKAQRHISQVDTPQRNILQGHAAIDSSDWLQSHMKEIRSHAKTIWAPYDRAGAIGLPKSTMGLSSIDGDSWLLTERRKQITAVQHSTPSARQLGSAVGPDAWSLQQAKKADAVRRESPQVSQRNRFHLMSAPDNKVTAKLGNAGHNGIDSWETGHDVQTKLLTPGALKQEHRGIKGTVDTNNYTISNEMKFQQHLTQAKVTDPQRHKGVTPTIPVDYYLHTEAKRERKAIAEANKFQSMPAPHVAPGDLMDVHRKGVQEAASQRHRVKQFTGRTGMPAGGARPAIEIDLYEWEDEQNNELKERDNQLAA